MNIYVHQVKYFIRKYRYLGKVLDYPNAHRLVDQFSPSVLLFSHLMNFGQMVLEGVHLIMKGVFWETLISILTFQQFSMN